MEIRHEGQGKTQRQQDTTLKSSRNSSYHSALSLDLSFPAAKAKRETKCAEEGEHSGTPEPQGPPHILPSADFLTLRTVLAVFGKGCLSSSFTCLFLYTSELYPTVLR